MAKFSQIVYHINVYHPKKSQDKPMRIDGVLFEVCHIMIVCHMTVHDGMWYSRYSTWSIRHSSTLADTIRDRLSAS